MADDPQNKIPSGRLARLAKMASLTARTATDLAIGQAKRRLGGDQNDFSQEKQAAAKVLETLGTMKGAAMKLGQQLAMDADALPPEARDIVSKLFAQAPPMPYEVVAKVIEEELGDPPDGVFATFDRVAAASASLGQVHKATLKDGTPVAVKVQYPGVAEALVNDLKNAGMFVTAFKGSARAMADLDPAPYYEEIRREIGAETDYLREARLNEEFAKAVSELSELHVPKTFAAYSTARVLTMEWVVGQPLKDFSTSDADPEARWRVGRQLALAVIGPFVGSMLIHGDPHPGNFLVRPDGRLTVLDFGAVKKFSPDFVNGFWGLMEAELDEAVPNFVPLLQGAKFRFTGDLGKARDTLQVIHDIASRPVRQPTYDWGACTMVPEMRQLFMSGYRDVLEVQAPPESLLFYRALGGMVQNLKVLRSAGPFRDVARQLTDMHRARIAAAK